MITVDGAQHLTFDGLNFDTGRALGIEIKNSDYTIRTLEKPTSKKSYFQPDYSNVTVDFKRIPDERSQLLWMPNFNLTTDTTTVEFYTSDQVGAYEIILEGFSFSGKPVRVIKTITVK